IKTTANTSNNTASLNTNVDAIRENTNINIQTGDATQIIDLSNKINNSDSVCCGLSIPTHVNDISQNTNTQTNIKTDQTVKIINNIKTTINTGENKAENNAGDITIKTG